jgi:hypothetical protein
MVKAHPIGAGVIVFFHEYAVVRYLVAERITGLGIIL